MGYGHDWRYAEDLMKTVYFVTEGKTDQAVIEALMQAWLGAEDFRTRPIQPPTSEVIVRPRTIDPQSMAK
jgi:hypothetical protein